MIVTICLPYWLLQPSKSIIKYNYFGYTTILITQYLITVSAHIERHSWLECQGTLFGCTMVIFSKKVCKFYSILGQESIKKGLFIPGLTGNCRFKDMTPALFIEGASRVCSKSDWYVPVPRLTGCFEIFLFSFSQLMSTLTLTEKIITKKISKYTENLRIGTF